METHTVSAVNHLEVESVVQDRFPNASASQQHRRADGQLDVFAIHEAETGRHRVQLPGGELRRIQMSEGVHGAVVRITPLYDVERLSVAVRRRHEHGNKSDERTAETLVAGKVDTEAKALTESHDVNRIVRQVIVKERKGVVRLSLVVRQTCISVVRKALDFEQGSEAELGERARRRSAFVLDLKRNAMSRGKRERESTSRDALFMCRFPRGVVPKGTCVRLLLAS